MCLPLIHSLHTMDLIHPYFYAGLDAQLQAFVACKSIPNWTPPTKESQFHAAVHIVADSYGITYDELLTPPDRRMIFVQARAMVFLYLRFMNYTHKEIGIFFGRDHSSVIHNVKNMCNTLDIKKAPERAVMINLLHQMGHIPMILVNTLAGSQYLHEIFNARKYSEFFDLNLAYFDQLSISLKKKQLHAKMTGQLSKLSRTESFHTWIKKEPLKGIYMRSIHPKPKEHAYS